MKITLIGFIFLSILFNFSVASADLPSYEPVKCWAVVYKESNDSLNWTSKDLNFHSGAAAGPDSYFQEISDLKFLVVVNSSLDVPIDQVINLVFFIIDQSTGHILSEKNVSLDLYQRHAVMLYSFQLDISTYITAELNCTR
jgi:hypothetical protein